MLIFKTFKKTDKFTKCSDEAEILTWKILKKF